jgi:hypothetical protein
MAEQPPTTMAGVNADSLEVVASMVADPKFLPVEIPPRSR